MTRHLEETLGSSLPSAVARWGGWSLLGVAVVLAAASAVIPVAETVGAAFEVVDARGAGVVVAEHDGVLLNRQVALGDAVERGGALATLRSDALAERAARARVLLGADEGGAMLETLETQRTASIARDEAETRRLEAEVRRAVADEQRARVRLDSAAEALTVMRGLHENGAASARELRLAETESRAAAADLAEARATAQAARSALASQEAERLQMEAVAARERQELEARVRGESGAREALGESDGPPSDLELRAPCAGTVVHVIEGRVGRWVARGDEIVRIACADAALEAHLDLPADGAGLVAEGQTAQLRFDAYPYAHYGSHHVELDWVSESAVPVDGAPRYVARAPLVDARFPSHRGTLPIREGMTGEARIVVTRRPLWRQLLDPARAMAGDL